MQQGEIMIGGKNIKEIEFEELMKLMSIVFQKVYLFHDTIENNIKFGKPTVTHEEVVEAARRACCHEFIEKLPNGYQTIIGEGGSTLSGGEKQRISIARAILKDAPIIILDEATSSVDPENQHALLTAINELTCGKTLIIIAHRLSTIKDADQIIVLDNGHVVQQGTHETLLQQDGIYRRFVKIRQTASSWKNINNIRKGLGKHYGKQQTESQRLGEHRHFFGTVYGDLNDCYDSRWNCTNSMVDLARYCGAFRRSIFTLLMTKVPKQGAALILAIITGLLYFATGECTWVIIVTLQLPEFWAKLQERYWVTNHSKALPWLADLPPLVLLVLPAYVVISRCLHEVYRRNGYGR